jgi:hypothetical protein
VGMLSLSKIGMGSVKNLGRARSPGWSNRVLSQNLVSKYTGYLMNIFGLLFAVPFVVSGLEIASESFIPVSLTSSPFLPLAEQSSGQYYYHDTDNGYILLRKAGQGVMGVDGRRSQLLCFRGLLEGDRITNATRVFPPYAPDSQWQVRDGTMVDLSQYQQVGQADDGQKEALKKCLEVFSR